MKNVLVQSTPPKLSKIEIGHRALRVLRVICLPLLLCGVVAFYVNVPLAATFFFLPSILLVAIYLLKQPVLCLILLIFLQQNDIFLAVLGVNSLNKALALFTAAAVMLSYQNWAQLKPALTAGIPLFSAMAGLVTVSALSSLHAQETGLAVSETFRLFNMTILATIVAFGVRDLRDVGIVIHAIIISMLVAASVTLIDFVRGEFLFDDYYSTDLGVATWGGEIRSRGTSLESVPMATTMMLSGLVYTFVLAVRAERFRGFYALATLIGAAAILATLTRSATLTLGLIAVVMLWRVRKEHYFRRMLGAMAVSVCLIVSLAPASNWSKFTAITSTSDKTVERRLGYQIIGLSLFAKHPFVGVGAGNYLSHYTSTKYSFFPGRSEESRPLHNIYLQMAVELGFAGAVLFVMVLAVSFIAARIASSASDHRARIFSEAVLLSLSALALQFLFLSSTAVPHFWISAGLSVAMLRIHLLERAEG